jgi:hypothetical protein
MVALEFQQMQALLQLRALCEAFLGFKPPD